MITSEPTVHFRSSFFTGYWQDLTKDIETGLVWYCMVKMVKTGLI